MASDDVTLRPVTRENLREVLALGVRDGQRHMVASNAVSIAEAYFEPGAWFRAVYAGDRPVGFMMVARDAEAGVDFLWRMMIAAEAQGRGYGRRAIELWIETTRRDRPHVRRLKLSHVPHAGHAGPFYERLGFSYTGEVEDSEPVMRLDLPPAARRLCALIGRARFPARSRQVRTDVRTQPG